MSRHWLERGQLGRARRLEPAEREDLELHGEQVAEHGAQREPRNRVADEDQHRGEVVDRACDAGWP